MKFSIYLNRRVFVMRFYYYYYYYYYYSFVFVLIYSYDYFLSRACVTDIHYSKNLLSGTQQFGLYYYVKGVNWLICNFGFLKHLQYV